MPNAWTPGPWDKIVRMEGYTAVGANALIARVFSPTFRDIKTETANAHLIAAAPELYAALEEISDALEGAKAADPEASIEFFEDVEIEAGWRKRLKDALAKARGEAPHA